MRTKNMYTFMQMKNTLQLIIIRLRLIVMLSLCKLSQCQIIKHNAHKIYPKPELNNLFTYYILLIKIKIGNYCLHLTTGNQFNSLFQMQVEI